MDRSLFSIKKKYLTFSLISWRNCTENFSLKLSNKTTIKLIYLLKKQITNQQKCQPYLPFQGTHKAHVGLAKSDIKVKISI